MSSAEPSLGEAPELLAGLDFTVFAAPDDPDGPLHGGFWPRRTRRPTVRSRRLDDGSRVALTPHRYGLVNSETRITEWAATALAQRSPASVAGLEAPRRSYLGSEVVATWGGSMHEALAPAVLVPEAAWAPATWGATHATTVRLHAEHARALGCGAWGFSPCARPGGGYGEFGVAPIAAGPGYSSTWRGGVVVTPHAAGLALTVSPDDAHANLSRLAALPGVYGPGGFVDSTIVGPSRARRAVPTAARHLVLDQGLLLAGIAHVLAPGTLHAGFTAPAVAARVRPAVAAALGA